MGISYQRPVNIASRHWPVTWSIGTAPTGLQPNGVTLSPVVWNSLATPHISALLVPEPAGRTALGALALAARPRRRTFARGDPTRFTKVSSTEAVGVKRNGLFRPSAVDTLDVAAGRRVFLRSLLFPGARLIEELEMPLHSVRTPFSAICSFAVIAVVASAAEIRTVPETPVWVADGVTEYSLFVRLDNHGLGGPDVPQQAATAGVQWRILNGPGFVYVEGSLGPPSSDDFYAGMSMFFELYQPPPGACVRVVQDLCGAPIDRIGYVGEYRFVVPLGFQPGDYTIDLEETGMIDCNVEGQIHDWFSDFITVVAPCAGERGDANCDGTTDFFDIDPVLTALFNPAAYAASFCNGGTCAVDADCSGVVDFFDIDPFLTCLFGECPACP